ncbi:MAG: dienelactone hydrolase family protein [Clostridia bacterium]|nr:dienelactone hydrolase family protein [Clostridia bacterium]
MQENFAEQNIFSDAFFTADISYNKATELLNQDGKNYDEYGYHDENCDIEAIFYEGYRNTKVFAYLGIPKGMEGQKFPAIILQHGGLGKAKRDWVKRWNEFGFVAIAPDLYGRGPEPDESSFSGQKIHPYAGIAPWGETGFLTDYENSGMYQSVVDVIYAHNLLRKLPCVDCSKIGITGISWGGVVATIVAGTDKRLAFASPVYGCGHLAEAKTYFAHNILDEDKTTKWDPAHFAAKSKIPILYVNGDSDGHFSVDITSATCLDTPNGSLAIYHNLEHGQTHGDSIQQIYNFAKSIVENKDIFVKITDTHLANGKLYVTASIPDNTQIKDAVFYYITTDELHHNGGEEIGWQSVIADRQENKFVFTYPKEATFGYASLTDEDGNIVSTPFTELK